MSSKSDWNSETGAGSDGSSRRLDRAIEGLRSHANRTPSWEETENLIMTPKKERFMPYVTHAGLFAYPKKAALVAVSTILMMLFVFAVPFSQEHPLGANIVFELADVDLAQLNEDYGDGSGRIDFSLTEFEEDESLGITEANVQIQFTAEQTMLLEMMVLTENGLVPESLVQRIKERYPFLANATVTINPVVERTSGTVYDHLTGDLRVEVDCEGKSPEEIRQEILNDLAARGVEGADVQVETEDFGGEEGMKINVTIEHDEEDVPEE